MGLLSVKFERARGKRRWLSDPSELCYNGKPESVFVDVKTVRKAGFRPAVFPGCGANETSIHGFERRIGVIACHLTPGRIGFRMRSAFFLRQSETRCRMLS